MHHAIALVASLTSLGLVCVLYYCSVHARPRSWLRGDMLAMILVAFLTGLFPLALISALLGLWGAISGVSSAASVLPAGADLASLGAIVATIVVFRALVKANSARLAEPANVAPPAPNAASPGSAPRKHRKAA